MLGYLIQTVLITNEIMLISFGIINAIAYALNDYKLKAIARSFASDIIVSLLLLWLTYAILYSNSFIYSSLDGSFINSTRYSCPESVSYDIFSCIATAFLAGNNYIYYNGRYEPTLADSVNSFLFEMYGLYIAVSAIGDLTINLFVVQVDLYYIMKPIISSLSELIDLLYFSLLSIYIQYTVILYITTISPLLLSIGVILRSIYPLRAIGSVIISAVIAFSIIMSSLYILDLYIYNEQSFILTQNISYYANSADTIYSYIGSNSPTAASYLQAYVESLSNEIYSYMNQIYSYIADVIFQVFVMPTINLIISLSAFRYLSKLLGGFDINLYRLGA
ncbi:MAG: hypothetical protein ARM1_0413 [Candidatus Micrarchaeota archaeon]|nr:MAG: hypothetical protein ARM1_0413 [Candidatus Micrarchaeota archaeon]